MKLPDIRDFIDYNPKVGPLQCLSVGYPGTGKSSQATQISIECLDRKNEALLMHGDITCEWRHFLRYSKYVKKILVLIPEDAQIQNIGIKKLSKYLVPLEFVQVNFNEINITKYLSPGQITVVYDDCYHSESKTILWEKFARQLVSRNNPHKLTITYLCHEAGNYYPQTATGDRWKSVDRFCEYFVIFRKMRIRALLLTQLETEVYERIRKKCIYKIYRICYPADRTHARLIKKYILKMRIDNYHLFFGSLFSPNRSNKATHEIRTTCMMIPRVLLNLKEVPINRLDSHVTNIPIWLKLREEHGFSYTDLEKIFGVPKSTIHYHCTKRGNSIGVIG
jgi:hypothetical protein